MDLPEPTALAPDLALVADAGAQDGPMGAGWALSGLSRIERRSSTGGVPSLGDTAGDLYRIDGIDLVLNPHTGCYEPMWWDGRCIQHDPLSNTWTVRKDGWTWIYGQTPDAGQAATVGTTGAGSGLDDTVLWLLSEGIHPSGDRVLWDYQSDPLMGLGLPGQDLEAWSWTVPNPTRVRYGAAELRFFYEPRPDWRLDAGLGALLVHADRLIGLEVEVQGQPYSAYSLEYADSPQWPLEGAEDCEGRAVQADPQPQQSVLRRILRGPAGAGPFSARALVLRCMQTADEANTWAAGQDLGLDLPELGVEPLGETTRWLRAHSANLNGDGLPDLVVFTAICTVIDTDPGTPEGDEPLGGVEPDEPSDLDGETVCEAAVRAWVNTDGAGPSAWDLPHEPVMVEDVAWTARLSALLPEGSASFAYALTDIDGDGWTDWLVQDRDDPEALVLLRWDSVSSSFVEDPVLDIDAETLAGAQLADLDGDGLPDLVAAAGASDTVGTWRRNTGEEGAWFSDADRPLLLPLDSAATPPSGLPGACSTEAPWSYPTEGPGAYTSAEAYRSAMTHLADLNGDGLLDAAVALHLCWRETGWGSTPDLASAFSRVFYGDGRGSFYDSGLSAGEPLDYAVATPAWGMEQRHYWNEHLAFVDVDRSGHPALLQYAGADGDGQDLVLGGVERGLWWGWFDPAETLAWPSDFDPGLSRVSGRVPSPAQVVVADWDGDGFPDWLVLEGALDDPTDANSGLSWTTQLHRSERDTAQGRITSITGAWGGETRLGWGFTAAYSGNNGGVAEGVAAELEGASSALRHLHSNQEVLRWMEGAQGRSEYRTLYGHHDGRRFVGFGVVEESRWDGSRQEHSYGLSPALRGAPIASARYRPDGSLERFTLNLYGQHALPLPSTLSLSWGLDTVAPYFNPMLRQCDFDVGFAASSGQTETVESLTQRCLAWEADGVVPSLEELYAAAGWLRAAPLGTAAAQVTELVWGDEESALLQFSGLGGLQLEPMGFPSGPDEGPQHSPSVVTEHPWTAQLPQLPQAPVPVGDSPTPFKMNVTEWRYNADTSLAVIAQRRDSDTPQDDLETTSTWVGFDSEAWGFVQEGHVTTGYGGAPVYEAETRQDFVAFNRPQRVQVCGDGALCVELGLTWEPRGAGRVGPLVGRVGPDGATETWRYDPICGVEVEAVDRAGRARESTLDSICRLEEQHFEGALTQWSWDEFNRVSGELHDPDTEDGDDGDQLASTHLYGEDAGEVLMEGLSVAATQAVWRSPGRWEFLATDGFGRETFISSCEAAGPDPSDPTALPGTPACTGSSRLSAKLRGADGAVLVQVAPHWDGEEDPVFLSFAHDHLGRVVAQEVPGEDPERSTARTVWEYGVGELRRWDALGVEELLLHHSTGEQRWTAGVFQGEQRWNAWDQVTERTDAAGRVVTTTYDGLGRVLTEEMSRDSGLSSGDIHCVLPTDSAPVTRSCTPTWRHQHDLVRREHTVIDPLGVSTTQGLDPLGRVLWQQVAGTVTEQRRYQDWVPGQAPSVVVEDEAGWEVTWTLDGWGRARSRSDESGDIQLWYSAGASPVLYEDERGRRQHLELDAWGQAAASCWSDGWDEGAQRCTSPRWWVQRDGAGRVITRIDADGVERGWSYTPGGQVEMAWQGAFTLEEREHDLLGRLRWSWSEGVERHFTRDALGRVLTVDLGDAGSPTVSGSYTWSDAGQLLSESLSPVAGSSATTRFDYSAYGWLRGIEHPDGATEALHYDALGRLRFHEDEVGARSRWDRDAQGRETYRRQAGEGERWTLYTSGVSWSGLSGLTEVTRIEGDGAERSQLLDGAGRVLAETLPDGTRMRHHHQGQERWASVHEDTSGQPLAMQITQFDAQTGMPTQRWAWFEDPGLVSSPDPADWNIPDPADYRVVQAWTAAGRLSSLSAGDETTTFTYEDGLLREESWDGGVRSRIVGRDGDNPRVSSETLWGDDGQSFRHRDYSYDSAGRLESVSIEDSVSGEVLEQLRTGLDALGRPSSTSRVLNGAEVSAFEWTWDPRGRPLSRSAWVDGGFIGRSRWAWYADGSLEAETTPSGRVLQHQRSLSSEGHFLLDSLLADGAPAVEILSRDGALRPTALRVGGARDLSLSWDGQGRLTQKQAGPGLGAGPMRWSGEYDERGRLAFESVEDEAGTSSHEYSFVEPGWLGIERHTERDGSRWGRDYLHDNSGRRVAQSDGESAYEALTWDGSLLIQEGETPITTSPFDEVTDDGEYQLRYDPDGELNALSDTDGPLLDLNRDPEGRPLWELDAAGAVRITHYGLGAGPLGHGELPLEIEAEGSISTPIVAEGLWLGTLTEEGLSPVFTDPRGTPLQVGAATQPSLSAFGEAASPLTERFAFAGMEAPSDAPGILLARHRAYHPRTGRFLSPDPIGLMGGLHRSRYASGDPLRSIDPSGLEGVDLEDEEDEDSASSENGSDSGAQEVEAGSQESRCAEDPESCASTASNPARRALRSLMYSLSDRAAARMEAEGYNPDTGEYDNHGFSIAGMDVEVTSRRSDRFAGAGLGWGATSGRGGSEGGGLTSADQAYNHGVNAAMLQGGADTLRALPTIGEQLVNLTLPPTPATTTEWSPTHLAMQIGAWEIEQSGIPTWLEAQAQQQLALGMANDGPSALDGVIDGGLFFYLAPFVLPSPLGKGGSAGRAAANADDLARAATIEVTKVDDLARVVDETAGGAGSSGTLTAGEIFEIQGIAKQFNTTIDVVGSRAAGQGRNIETNFPVGKEPPGATRSDIDFRVDANHPQVDALCSACQKVGGGAGSASPRYSNNPASVGGRETVPPYIRFTPDGVELIPPEGF